MTYFIVLAIYVLMLFVRRKELSAAEKWLLWLAPLTLSAELLSNFMARRFGNNMPVFHVYTAIETFFLFRFFNEAAPSLKRYRAGKWLAFGGLLLAVLDVVFWQPLFTINSVVLIFESFFVCVCCLITCSDLLRCEAIDAADTRLFRVTGTMLIYYAFTFFYWSLFPMFLKYLTPYMVQELVPKALLWSNLFFYTSLTIIFARRKRLSALKRLRQEY